MNEAGKQSPFTRKKLTPFLAHEMIYDYASGTLDGERRVALEDFIAKDRESQILLKNLEIAQEFVVKLTDIEVDRQILEHLLEAESAVSLGRRYSSWREWPETLRWSVTAIAMSAVVAGAVALVPWSKLAPHKAGGPENVEVAQIPQPHAEDAETVAVNDDQGSGDEPPDDAAGEEGSGDDVADTGSGDDEAADLSPAAAKALAAKQAAADKADAEKAAAKIAADQKADAAKVAGLSEPKTPTSGESTTSASQLARTSWFSSLKAFFTSPKPAPTATQQVAAATPVPASGKSAPAKPSATPKPVAVVANSKPETDTAADETEAHETKAKGFVYRAFMTLDNLEDIGPKITADLVALGAEKAGEVELGWRRGTGRYYHFALPETNEKKVIERLQVYGPVRISKDPHPRVMPPGQVRFILWVESASQ